MQDRSRKKTWFARFALLVGVTGMCLLAAELCVRWLIPVRNVGPSWSEYHPIYLQRLKKNLHCRRRSSEFDIEFTTNSLGFRGPEPTRDWREVLLFLGDSFTLGYGVSDGQEYPAVVGDLLSDCLASQHIGVLNAGIGAAGNGHWVKFLQREAEQYRPRFVVLQVCANDVADNVSEHLFRLTRRGDLKELEVPPPSAARNLQSVIEQLPLINSSYLYGLVRQVHLPMESPRAVTSSAAESSADGVRHNKDLTFALITASLEICRQHDWPALILTAGLRAEDVAELSSQTEPYGVDVLPVPTRRHRPDLYFKVDGHWNSLGHRYVAQLCASYIAQNLEWPVSLNTVRRLAAADDASP